MDRRSASTLFDCVGSSAFETARLGGGLHRNLRQLLERLAHLLGRVLVVLELALQVALVRAKVEVAMPGQVERDRLGLPGFPAAKRLVDDDADRVR